MLKGIFLIGTGTLLAQIIKVFSSPIITRLYGPQNYGLFSVYSSLLSVITLAASFQYEFALPIPKDDRTASDLFSLCISLVAFTSISLLLLILVFSNSLLSLLGASGLGLYIWLTVPAFFIAGISQVFTYWTIRRRNYGIITYTKIYQSIGNIISKIPLGIVLPGPLGLMVGDLISSMCGLGKMISKTWQEDKYLFKKGTFKTVLSTASEYRRFPLFTCTAEIINALAFQVPLLLISSLYGLKEAGYYSLSSSVLFIPLSLIGGSLSQVYLGEVTVFLRGESNNKRLESLYLSTTYKLALIGIPLIGVIAFVAPIIFPVVFGDKWLDSGIYCLPLAFLAISNFIISPTSNLDIYGFNHWKLIWDIARTLSVFGCFLIGYQMKLSIMNTLWLYVIIMVLSYVVCFYMNIKAIRSIKNRTVTSGL